MIIRSLERRYRTPFLHYWRSGRTRRESGTPSDADLPSFKPGVPGGGRSLVNPVDLFHVSGAEQIGNGSDGGNALDNCTNKTKNNEVGVIELNISRPRGWSDIFFYRPAWPGGNSLRLPVGFSMQ